MYCVQTKISVYAVWGCWARILGHCLPYGENAAGVLALPRAAAGALAAACVQKTPLRPEHSDWMAPGALAAAEAAALLAYAVEVA